MIPLVFNDIFITAFLFHFVYEFSGKCKMCFGMNTSSSLSILLLQNVRFDKPINDFF